MGLSITVDSSLTFRRLQELQAAGYSVFKTPHVGSMHHNNLVCAQLGIKLILCDTLSGETDKRFRPHGIKVNGVFEPLGSSGQLATHIRVEKTSVHAPELAVGDLLLDYHLKVARAACPGAEILTDGAYLRQHQKIVEHVCDLLLQSSTSLWRRYVHTNGTTEAIQRQVHASEISGNLFRIHHADHGWAMPLPIRILLDAICEAVTTGKDAIYSLSGPDMHVYITDKMYTATVPLWYEKVRAAGVLNLPENLNLVIVPVQEARLAGPKSEQTAINEVAELIQRLSELVAQLSHALYDNATAESALTQHDLIAGEELYIDPSILDIPMSTFEALSALMAAVRK